MNNEIYIFMFEFEFISKQGKSNLIFYLDESLFNLFLNRDFCVKSESPRCIHSPLI